MTRLAPSLALLTTLVVGLSISGSVTSRAAAGSNAPGYPSSIVALGHSWTTGYDSDPARPGFDVLENSWIVGTNPKVRSIYSRLLALNPAIRGRQLGLGLDGAKLADIVGQVTAAIAVQPDAELVVLQGIDNDILCDGRDASRFGAYGRQLTTQLRRLSRGLPKARIFVIGQPVSVRAWTKMLGGLPPSERAGGTGPCDVYDASGKLVPAHVAYLERVVAGYLAQTAAACARVPRCFYDQGAAQKIVFTLRDITEDRNHPSVSGAAKLAAAEWAAMKRAGVLAP